MSIQNELKALLYVVPRLLREFWEDERNVVRSYTHFLFILLLTLLAVGGGYLGYRWYMLSKGQTVQREVAMRMEEFQRILAGAPEAMPAQLAQLESVLTFDYNLNQRNKLAPMFLLLQADVQLQQQKEVETLDTLQRLITILATSPLQPLIKTKRALLQLDSADVQVKELGLQNLTQLAYDTDNTQRDSALFYLGRYYWVHDQLDEAKRVWQELIDTPTYTGSFPSPWVYEAQEALAQVDS